LNVPTDYGSSDDDDDEDYEKEEYPVALRIRNGNISSTVMIDDAEIENA